MMPRIDTEVTIIGGGIVGGSAALFLRRVSSICFVRCATMSTLLICAVGRPEKLPASSLTAWDSDEAALMAHSLETECPDGFAPNANPTATQRPGR